MNIKIEPLIDEQLFFKYCLEFYGYGNLNSDYWFIGIEEGGSQDLNDFYKTSIQKWNGCYTVDIRSDNTGQVCEQYFGTQSRIQKTWGGIIQLILGIEQKQINRQSIIYFQSNLLGKADGNNLLLELLPLPHRSTANWDYHSLTAPQFKTRKSYIQYFVPERIRIIKKLIAEQQPEVVVFYSSSRNYLRYWVEIMGLNKTDIQSIPLLKKIDKTMYCICKHPAAYGITKSYFSIIGKNIREQLMERTWKD